MADFDQVAIERRIGTVEAETRLTRQEVQSGFAGVHERLDRLNGQVASNTSWRIDHQTAHEADDAFERGEREGRVAITRRTMAVLGVGGALVMVMATTTAQLLVTRLLGG